MSRPMSTTELLQAILEPVEHHERLEELDLKPEIEAEPKWCPSEDGEGGQAQAGILIGQNRYTISLEKLP